MANWRKGGSYKPENRRAGKARGIARINFQGGFVEAFTEPPLNEWDVTDEVRIVFKSGSRNLYINLAQLTEDEVAGIELVISRTLKIAKMFAKARDESAQALLDERNGDPDDTSGSIFRNRMYRAAPRIIEFERPELQDGYRLPKRPDPVLDVLPDGDGDPGSAGVSP